ncbi:MAG: hypothetical protein P0S93_01320 [Candidatus Neptunochlamydia sp.]|nr:hypothetical protein [Candidatus Neptunochlamydia sp.]
MGSTHPKSSVAMELLLKWKNFYVIHGGSNPIINHHFSVSAQRYATDITKLNSYGFRASSLFPSQLKDFFIYETTVYSSCDRVIIDAVDEHEDLAPREMNSSHPAGNSI